MSALAEQNAAPVGGIEAEIRPQGAALAANRWRRARARQLAGPHRQIEIFEDRARADAGGLDPSNLQAVAALGGGAEIVLERSSRERRNKQVQPLNGALGEAGHDRPLKDQQ